VSLSAYDLPFTELESKVIDWAQECLELRHGEAGDPEGKLREPDPSSGISGVMTTLRRVRSRSDRVEEFLAKATQARARARRARDEAAFASEIAYDEAALIRAARRHPDLFSSGKERHAEASTDSLNERRDAHQARRLVSVTEEAYDVITQVHWQLDAIRKDLRASLHALQFESGLER